MATPEQLKAAGFSEEEILADAGFAPDEIGTPQGGTPAGQYTDNPSPVIQSWEAARAGTIDGLKDVPSALYNSIATPVAAIAQGVRHPVNTYNKIATVLSTPEGRLQSVNTVGKLGAGMAGTLGMAALTTNPIGAGLGLAASTLGYDKLNSALGNAPALGMEDKTTSQEIHDFTKNIATGSGSTFAIQKLSQALQGLKEPLQKEARSLDRKSIGAREGDYAKTANDLQTIELTDAEVQTLTKKSLDDLLVDDKLGKSRDPSDLIKTAADKQGKLSGEIGELIGKFDDANKKPVSVEWKKARELLDELKVPADEITRYERRLEKIQKGIEGSGGTLRAIENQKVALGKKWDPSDTTANEFNRALYTDLKRTIESRLPQVRDINTELQKYKIADKIIKRALAKSENAEGTTALLQALRTSGGIGVPLLAGYMTGAPLVGALGGAGVYAATSPTGRATLSNVLDKASTASTTYGSGLEKLAGALGGVAALPR